jgi:hypothetical protein
LVEIDVTCHLESFRRFLVNSTCRSFIPESYLRDPEVFPEKESEPGSIYIEAADKVTLKKIRDISFVNANEILGIIYTSKSGHSKLKWRQQNGPMGRVTGDASNNSLVNLSMARIITPEYVEELIGRSEEGASGAPAQGQEPTESGAEAQAHATPQEQAATTATATGGAAATGAEDTPATTTVTTAPPPQPEEKAPSSGPSQDSASSSPAADAATTLRPDEVAESMEPKFPPDEEEDDFEAADADEEEQEEVDEQAREEMA